MRTVHVHYSSDSAPQAMPLHEQHKNIHISAIMKENKKQPDECHLRIRERSRAHETTITSVHYVLFAFKKKKVSHTSILISPEL